MRSTPEIAGSAPKVMTGSEAASRLRLGEDGTKALAKLCPEGEKGCDPGTLCGLVIWLTEGPVELQARDRDAGSGACELRSRPVLPAAGRFAPIPDDVESAAPSTASAVDWAGPPEQLQQRPPTFTTRELERLAGQLKRGAKDLLALFAGW